MFIDINARVGHWPFQKLRYASCAALLERMNRFRVSQAVVSSLNGIFYKNTQSANEELIGELRSNPRFGGRFIPFAVINPLYAAWEKDLDTCHRKLGMQGVCVYPQYHDYDIHHPSLIKLAEAARDRGLPLALTVRMVDTRQRFWMDIQKEWTLNELMPIAGYVPDGKYMFLNIASGYRLNEENARIAHQTNLLLDTSGRGMSDMPDIIRTYGRTKIAFGSHSPILDYLTGQLRIAYLSAEEADDETKRLLQYRNAQTFLGLKK
ncbi:amidohydrolase family protein [Parapedobacter sp. GCM10030251]|uniref:amidohydrolase family protein n=1 Tax=Parapedobacter sp. GCM10030251 TaxID=3273419 RepID=UPI00360DD72A